MSSAKQYGQEAEKDRRKQHLALGIAITLIVGALILWNNWPKTSHVTAAQIGKQEFTVNEVNYYYTQVYNNTWQMAKMYEQYGMPSEYDVTLTPEDQMYDEASGKTYADYFRETALSQLQEIAILKDQATTAEYSLSKEGTASVKSQLESIDSQILQLKVKNGGNETYYLKAMYGENMTKSLLTDIITDITHANEYAKHHAEQLTFDKAALTAHYETNAAALDSYDFRLFHINAEPESAIDAEGNALDPTDEQMADAMDNARGTANAMAAKIKRGADFNTMAQNYAKEDDKVNYDDPNSTLTVDALGSSLTTVYGDWLKDSARRSNAVGVVEQDGSGVYVLQFITREKRDHSFQTVDIGSILITADTTETTDTEGNITKSPTAEQLTAAQAKAEKLLSQWNTISDKTPEAFLALVPAGNKTSSGQTITELVRNTYGKDFDQWVFTPDNANVGDTTIVEATDDSTGAVIGYRLVNLTAFGQSRWAYEAETALRNAEYTLWFEGLKAEYAISPLEGMNLVGKTAT